MLTGLELLIALLAVVVGATIMGTVSFGMGLVVAPVLLLFLEPKAAIVTVNAIIPILLSFVLLTTWRHLKFNRLKGMAIGGILAVPLGVLVLDSANPTALRLIIGAAILCLGVLNLLNIQLPMAERRGSGLLVGFLTSLSITTLSIGGPLAAAYIIAQHWEREQMRAALAFYFLCSYIVAFAVYAAIGLVDRDTLFNIAFLVPSLVVGFGIGALLARRMNTAVFRYVAIGVIITGSVVLLGQEVSRVLAG
ncbi:MAG: sulfite exporter TauE/SafE family protein [Chloroflexota bacterium]|nr:sulfite exporter TauE/SafE family protein [Chloroflexota bacterium]